MSRRYQFYLVIFYIIIFITIYHYYCWF